jgi:hypothetical protein
MMRPTLCIASFLGNVVVQASPSHAEAEWGVCQWQCQQDAQMKWWTPACWIAPDVFCLSETKDDCIKRTQKHECEALLSNITPFFTLSCSDMALMPSSSPGSITATSWCPSGTTSSTSPLRVTTITYVVIAIFIVIFLILSICYIIRSRRAKARRQNAIDVDGDGVFTADRSFLQDEKMTRHLLHADSVNRVELNMGELNLYRLDETQLRKVHELAKGAYGEVSMGYYKDTKVAIKKLLNPKDVPTIQNFINEINLMVRYVNF